MGLDYGTMSMYYWYLNCWLTFLFLQNSDTDAWDDTALIKAYDEAVSQVKVVQHVFKDFLFGAHI